MLVKIHVMGRGSVLDVARILSAEREFEFINADDPAALMHEGSLTVMESIEGLGRVRVYDDFRHISDSSWPRLHAGELFELARRENKRIKVIGLPSAGDSAGHAEAVRDSLLELRESAFQQLARR